MQYTFLGPSGLQVSRLCLGTMNFGWTTDEATAFQIMDHALDAGINFFDTADSMAGRRDQTSKRATASPRRSSGDGWHRSGAATGLRWPRRCINRWTRVRTIAACRRTTFGKRARTVSADCKPIRNRGQIQPTYRGTIRIRSNF
jgi:hypothetical protein